MVATCGVGLGTGVVAAAYGTATAQGGGWRQGWLSVNFPPRSPSRVRPASWKFRLTGMPVSQMSDNRVFTVF